LIGLLELNAVEYHWSSEKTKLIKLEVLVLLNFSSLMNWRLENFCCKVGKRQNGNWRGWKRLLMEIWGYFIGLPLKAMKPPYTTYTTRYWYETITIRNDTDTPIQKNNTKNQKITYTEFYLFDPAKLRIIRFPFPSKSED
jgi:hypothetical protein